jgi:ATP-dependent Clp protease adapter protein ClpS
MKPLREYIDLITEAETIDRDPVRQREEVPLHIPGGATVVVFNDPVTPFEVAVEAVISATGLSEDEAIRRMMAAHRSGYAPVAAYANKDIAETVADRIMQHAQQNRNYDHYRTVNRHPGPWPLHAEVLDAEQ